MTIPYTFAGATTAIPLAQLDANFASPITLGNVAMTLSNTYTSIGNLTLTNTTISSGNATVTNANITTLTTTNDASISGLTVGKGAGSSIYNTVVGLSGLSSASNTGLFQTAIGWYALLVNTTGTANTALGAATLYANTTGSNNVAVGSASAGNSPLQANTTGSFNTGIGNNALGANTTASNNTAVGYQALYTQSGSLAGDNTAVGSKAGYYITTGGQNTLIGELSGANITTGTYNKCIGYLSGDYGATALTTGNYNCYIGDYTIPSASSVTYEQVFGYGGTGKGTQTAFITSNSGCYQGSNSATWAIASDQRLKKNIVDNTVGLSAITAIQVRNFEYRLPEEITELEPQNAIDIKGVQLGAIAQELQAILPDCVKTQSTGVMSVDTTNLTWYLINAVKELNAKLEAQSVEIATLKGK